MNNHYHNVRAASSVPSLWTIDQLREMGELRTLIDQLHWNRDDLARAQCSEIEYLRFILHSQEGAQPTQERKNGIV